MGIKEKVKNGELTAYDGLTLLLNQATDDVSLAVIKTSKAYRWLNRRLA